MENKKEVIAIFDKPKSCLHCPCLSVYKLKSICKLNNTRIESIEDYKNRKDCPLIDYEEFMESMDLDNYK